MCLHLKNWDVDPDDILHLTKKNYQFRHRFRYNTTFSLIMTPYSTSSDETVGIYNVH